MRKDLSSGWPDRKPGRGPVVLLLGLGWTGWTGCRLTGAEGGGGGALGEYLVLVVLLLVGLIGLRRPAKGRVPANTSEVSLDTVDPLVAAALVGGSGGLLRAGLVSLAQRGWIVPVPGEVRVQRVFGDANVPGGAPLTDLEASLFAQIPESGVRMETLREWAVAERKRMRPRLVAAGWEISTVTEWSRRVVGGLAVLGVAGIGAASFWRGFPGDTSAAFVLGLALVTLVGGLSFLCKLPRRTRAGRQFMARLRQRYFLQTTAAYQGRAGNGWRLAPLLAGLYGTLALTGSTWEPWQSVFPRRPAFPRTAGNASSGSDGGGGGADFDSWDDEDGEGAGDSGSDGGSDGGSDSGGGGDGGGDGGGGGD